MNKTPQLDPNDFAQTRLLRAHQVAEWLQVSAAMVYRLIRLGELPGVRIGTSVRVRESDVAAYIAASSTTSGDVHG